MNKQNINFIYIFQVLYMWSRNASGLSFPADSAITVGGSSSVQLLVLQVHYIDNSNIGGFQLLDLIITELKSHMTC